MVKVYSDIVLIRASAGEAKIVHLCGCEHAIEQIRITSTIRNVVSSSKGVAKHEYPGDSRGDAFKFAVTSKA
jgi:hypothetical protein